MALIQTKKCDCWCVSKNHHRQRWLRLHTKDLREIEGLLWYYVNGLTYDEIVKFVYDHSEDAYSHYDPRNEINQNLRPTTEDELDIRDDFYEIYHDPILDEAYQSLESYPSSVGTKLLSKLTKDTFTLFVMKHTK